MMLSVSLLVLIATAPLSFANEAKFRELAKIGLNALSDVPGVRELQAFEGFNEYEVLHGVLNFYGSRCENQINAVLTEQNAQTLTAIIKCVKSATLDLVDNCFANFPGVFNPIECTAELALSDTNIFLLLNSGILDGLEDFDPEYLASAIPSDFDVSQFIDTSIFSPVDSITSQQCSAAFGTANLPKFVSCLSLIEQDDIDSFIAALENNFFEGVNGCSQLRGVFGVQNGEEVTIDLGYEFNGAAVEAILDLGYNQNFDACSELDDGALADTLDRTFVTRDGNTANIAKANLIVGLVVVLAAILN